MVGQQFARRAVGEDRALVEHDDPVGQQQGLHDVVGDHDRGQAEPVVQRAVVAAEIVAGDRIERAERLVHQHDRRAGRQRPRHADPLALPSRKSRWQAVPDLRRQGDQRQQGLGPRGDAALVPARPGADPTAMFSVTVMCGNRPTSWKT